MKRLTSLIVCIFWVAQAYAADIRVEPANWWVGMKRPELQLMIHAENIAETQVQLNYAGVVLQRVIRVENPNYLFLDLYLMPGEVKAGNFPIRFMKGKEKVHEVMYELWDREPGSANRKGFDQSDVMYLITPDRFANGNTGNDQVPGMLEGLNRANEDGRHGGDIAGIVQHLDYISRMGFSAVWLTPVLENNQPDYSYHGYSTTDFYRVDPRIGSNEEYRELSQKAKAKGIKLIMDMIFNHCGTGHWWMKDLPARDWLNFSDAPIYTNHRKTVIQDPYVAKADSVQLVDGWFSRSMPDLNQRNPQMATYLIQNSIWWVEYAGLGGIRVDTYPYPDKNFMSEWTGIMMQEYPNLNIVGEEWSSNPAMVSYWQRGKKNANGYISWLPSLMDFPVQEALIKGLNETEKYNSGGIMGLYEMLANDFQYANPDNLVVFGDNHDIKRIHNQLNGDEEKIRLALAFILTSRGIPQLFYGTEIMMRGESHGTIRSDFPGGWAGDKVNGFTGQGLTAEQKSMQDFVRTIIQWRKTSPLVLPCKMTHYRPLNEIYVYARYNEKGTVLVILNKNKTDQTIQLDRFADRIGSATKGREIISGKQVSLTGSLQIPAGTPYIIQF
jgi:glycosidase